MAGSTDSVKCPDCGVAPGHLHKDGCDEGGWPMFSEAEVWSPNSADETRADRIRRADELSRLSGVKWARCYADLLEADLNPHRPESSIDADWRR